MAGDSTDVNADSGPIHGSVGVSENGKTVTGGVGTSTPLPGVSVAKTKTKKTVIYDSGPEEGVAEKWWRKILDDRQTHHRVN